MIDEIRRRMEERKASKKEVSGHTDAKEVKMRTSDATSTHEKDSRKGTEELKKVFRERYGISARVKEGVGHTHRVNDGRRGSA